MIAVYFYTTTTLSAGLRNINQEALDQNILRNTEGFYSFTFLPHAVGGHSQQNDRHHLQWKTVLNIALSGAL